MADTSFSLGKRVRLSAMMFLQYMLLPVWFMPLSTYLTALQIEGFYRGATLATMALGCLASPLIGMVADRHFASEKVLAVLNLLTAVLLALSARVTDPMAVFLLLLAVMLCYMPTWGLTSSIAMSHSPAEKFPQVRVFGSLGWISAGIFSVAAMWGFGKKIDGTEITLYCGAAVAVAAALFALALPHTPPPAKGKETSLLDVLGLRSLVLMKDFSFAVLILTYIAVQWPFSIFFAYCGKFLEDKGFEFITVTMNFGPVTELVCIPLVALLVARIGLKWTMSIGLGALAVRYVWFLAGARYDITWLLYAAILVHGLIFGFYFVAAQIYVDKKAPKETKAQAQAFLFMCYGVGSIAGIFANEWLIGANTHAGKINWDPVWTVMTASSAVLLVAFVALFHDKRRRQRAEVEHAEAAVAS